MARELDAELPRLRPLQAVHHPTCVVCNQHIPAGPDGRITYREAGFWRERYCPFHTEAELVRCAACSRLQRQGALRGYLVGCLVAGPALTVPASRPLVIRPLLSLCAALALQARSGRRCQTGGRCACRACQGAR
jgi:hypothetical protein